MQPTLLHTPAKPHGHKVVLAEHCADTGIQQAIGGLIPARIPVIPLHDAFGVKRHPGLRQRIGESTEPQIGYAISPFHADASDTALPRIARPGRQ